MIKEIIVEKLKKADLLEISMFMFCSSLTFLSLIGILFIMIKMVF